VAEWLKAPDSKFNLAFGRKRNHADRKDFLSQTSPARGTHLDCFGLYFRCAGYKKGYKARHLILTECPHRENPLGDTNGYKAAAQANPEVHQLHRSLDYP
jgi:hypothetical protein